MVLRSVVGANDDVEVLDEGVIVKFEVDGGFSLQITHRLAMEGAHRVTAVL